MPQITHNAPVSCFKSEKIWFVVKLLLLLFIVTCVAWQLRQEQVALQNLWQQLVDVSKKPTFVPYLVGVVLLCPLNWALEARKWQLLVSDIQTINFWTAFETTLTGLSLGVITPALLGDSAAKLLRLKASKRQLGLAAVMLGNGVQYYIALFFGTISLIYFQQVMQAPHPAESVLLLLLVLSLLVGLLFFGNLQQLHRLGRKLPYSNKLAKYLSMFNGFRKGLVLRVFAYALVRYLTFCVQFYLVCLLFFASIPTLSLWVIICLIFLAKTVIPSFNFLSDLGVREFSALYFFKAYSVPASQVVSATLSLWFINILVPVIVGSILLIQLKLLKNT